MSADKLIVTLEKLLKLHENLYEVTLQKTELLKHDRVDELKELLKKEQMFIQAIKQVEEERIMQTIDFLGNINELTLSACIEKSTGIEKEKLELIRNKFTAVINELKDRNKLNKELTKQAIQLTSVTLDMIMPQESDINYNKPTNKSTEKQRRSIFDSKA